MANRKHRTAEIVMADKTKNQFLCAFFLSFLRTTGIHIIKFQQQNENYIMFVIKKTKIQYNLAGKIKNISIYTYELFVSMASLKKGRPIYTPSKYMWKRNEQSNANRFYLVVIYFRISFLKI